MTRKSFLVLGGFLLLVSASVWLVTSSRPQERNERISTNSLSQSSLLGTDGYLSDLGAVRLSGDLPLDPSSWVSFGKSYSFAPERLSCGCFAPGTPQDNMDQWYDNMVGDLQGNISYNLLCRWGGSNGSPRFLTWSFVPDGVFIPSGVGEPGGNNELFSRMDALFGGNRALWISKFQEVFDRWEAIGGTSYERRTASGVDWDDGAAWGASGGSTRGDVRIGMKNIDGGSNTLAYNPFPCSTNGGDMVMDRAESWQASGLNYRFLRNVVAHEHGHGMGILHVCPVNNTKLMEPTYSGSYDGPRHDDVRAQHRFYGDAFENDDTAFIATDLGVLEIGSPLSVGQVPGLSIPNATNLSLDRNGDVDFFQFTLNVGREVTATAVPQGLIYDSSPECSSGNNVNSLAIANLQVDLYESDGVTVIASCDNSGLAQSESCTGSYLSAGNYFVRVSESNSPTEVQMYRLDLIANQLDACIGVECDDGLFCNGEETCDNGNCIDGTPPCDPVEQSCNEVSDVCEAAPGACCLPDGTCEIFGEGECGANAGFYYGSGTDCAGPLDPPCVAAPTILSCEPGNTLVFPDTSVDLTVFIEDVMNLANYQVGIDVVTTGTGSATLDCAGCNGLPNEPSCGVRIDEDRGDWVFNGAGTTITVPSCSISAGGSLLLIGSVTVPAATQAYLIDYTLDISSDATPGTEFEVIISQNPLDTALTDASNNFIGFQTQSCILTVADAGDCIPPAATNQGSRTIEITPVGAAPQALLVTGSSDPDVACVSLYVQADGTLGPVPVFQTPAEWGTINARGVEIIPDESYNVQAECNSSISPPVSVSMWSFGDLDNNGLANLADTFLAVQAFQGDFSNVTPGAADVDPCTPNGINNLGDAFLTVLGFQGQTFADVCPAPCGGNTTLQDPADEPGRSPSLRKRNSRASR
ncbi:MAG: matrixin family metalloprotease [Phycisphaerae bacterium]